ncbi:t-SNARE [Catenaria anguillulae PL171]|uniref:t-SNARE n=1 Tax=Catenaria anguillulae PL171 TaxID=765915 RepID=A0A1Y2HKR4_9FUNG|nr:t-SNARE [Catenaria anguillulae PL171]
MSQSGGYRQPPPPARNPSYDNSNSYASYQDDSRGRYDSPANDDRGRYATGRSPNPYSASSARARSQSRAPPSDRAPPRGDYNVYPPPPAPASLRGGGGGGVPGSPGGGSAGARDRMAELRAAGVQRPVTMVSPSGGGGGDGITDFLDDIAALDKSLRRVQDDINYIAKLHRRAFDAVPEHVAADNKRELDGVSQQTKSQLQKTRKTLDALDAEHQGMRKGTADYVMCGNQLTNLKKNYQSMVQEFHRLETEFGSAQKDRMLREMRVVKADANEDDLEEYLASGGQGGIFAQQVLHSSRYGDARRALRQVEDRQAELVKIERMVEELAQLFLDLNTLIEQQDYTINQVAEYVEEAVVNIEQGEKQVEEAVEIRKNTIKWSWYVCICLIITLIGVAVYLFVFGPFSFLLFGAATGGGSNGNAAATPTKTAGAAAPTPTGR